MRARRLAIVILSAAACGPQVHPDPPPRTEVIELGRSCSLGHAPLARIDGHAIFLDEHTVLVSAGHRAAWAYEDRDPLACTETYDLDTGEWQAAGDLPVPVSDAAATRLANGEVLIIGGNPYGGRLGSKEGTDACQIYSPETRSWRLGPPLPRGLMGAAAAPLPDGGVLVTGGVSGGDVIEKATLIFDPRENRWREAAPLKAPRAYHSAAALPDGRVFVFGGYESFRVHGLLSYRAEVFDPVRGVWTSYHGRARPPGHTTTVLQDGRVLVVGLDDPLSYQEVARPTADIFDPVTGRWVAATPPRGFHDDHSATLLPDGRVVIIGGEIASPDPSDKEGEFDTSPPVEIYSPATDSWVTLPADRSLARRQHLAIPLDSSRILVIGGFASPNILPPALVTID